MERRQEYTHPEPPCNVEIFKGYKNAVLTRPFLKFATENPFALTLYRWIYPTSCPEEHFMATLATLSTFQFEKAGRKYLKVFQRFDGGAKAVKGNGSWEKRRFALS